MEQCIYSGSYDAEKIANDLLLFVNYLNHDSETFAKTIAHAHKTLQQSVMRLFVRTIREMADVYPDARNEQTVKLAKRIAEIADEYPLPLV